MNNEEFKGKVVFITGVSSGIGQAQALAFLQQGASVYGLDCTEGELTTFQQDYQDHFAYSIGSVANQQEVQKAVQLALSKFGKIDILLNTAGILDGYATSLETDEALWDKILNTNLKGMYLVTNAILPNMLEQKHGVIVNMASIAGMVAGGGGAAYTASKHGIVGYTKQLTYDYAKLGIRVNAIAPGAIETPMNQADFAGTGEMAQWVAKETPAGRWAQPGEVAELTLFLASQRADYIHGTVMPIDGGWLEK